MSIVERIKALFGGERDRDTADVRIDAQTAARHDVQLEREGGSIPPNYLPTGVDEHRPRK